MGYEEPRCFLMSHLLESLFDASKTDGLLGLVKKPVECEARIISTEGSNASSILFKAQDIEMRDMEVGDSLWLRQYDKYVSIQGINEDKMTVTVSDDLSAHIGDSYRVIFKAMVPCLESYEDLD